MPKRPPGYLRTERLVKLLLFCFVFGFSLAFLGFVRLVIEAPSTADQRRIYQPKVERGSIYDRNGRLLASQVKRESLEAWPQMLTEPQDWAAKLAEILQLDAQELLEQLSHSQRRYLWVKRFLGEREATLVRKLIERENIRGLRLWPEYSRIYPQGPLASHLIGFTNIDNVGLDGVEMSTDAWLRSADGLAGSRSQVVYGDDVYLTIDIETQYLIDKIARRALLEQQADNLIAILMDANNGDILSYLSLPEYNPSLFNHYSEEIRRNIPVTNVYEPGSVFKIFPMAIFLDLKLTNLDEILSVGTVYNPEIFQRYQIAPIADVTKHGPLSLTEVLIYSSNVGMATLSERIDAETLYQRLIDFGFGRVTGVPLPGESYGLLKKPKDWSLRTKPTIVFGQEIATTSLQLVSAATAITNGGVLLAPQIISRVLRSDGVEVLHASRQPIKEVVSPATAAKVLLMMEQVVSSPFGTMRDAQVDGLRISGKSGTAQVFDSSTGRYDPNQVNSSILAIFPTESPEFILYISLKNPKGAVRYGGRIASPLAREIIFALANRYNLPLAGNLIARHDGHLSSVSVRPPQQIQLGSKLPSFLGLSKKELLPVLRDPRLQLEMEGSGHVVWQQPGPGALIPEEGLAVEVRLQ